MCRSIKPLFNVQPGPDDAEIRAAAVQFVRKISGFSKPSKVNGPAFEIAVEEITASVTRLLAGLQTAAPPKARPSISRGVSPSVSAP